MKKLRIAKMVSVFSKRSMLACMIAGGMLSLNSCDKVEDGNMAPSELSKQVKIDINYKSDAYLTFKNFEEAEKMANQLYDKPVEFRNSFYAKQDGFIAMETLFENALDEIKAITLMQEQTKTETNLNSIIVAANPTAFIKSESSYDMNVTDPKFALIVNRSRIVKIGHTLYQYNLHDIKAIPSGDYKLVARLATESIKQGRIGKSSVFVSPIVRSSTPIEGNKSAKVNSIRECKGFFREGGESSNLSHQIKGDAFTLTYSDWDYTFVGYDADYNEVYDAIETARHHKLYLGGYTQYRGWFGGWYSDKTTNSSMEGRFGYTINNVGDVADYVNTASAGNAGTYGPNTQHFYGQQPHAYQANYSRTLVDMRIPLPNNYASSAVIEFVNPLTQHKFVWPEKCDCTITY